MRRLDNTAMRYGIVAVLILAIVAIGAMAASGAVDLGDGACQQTDGQTGLWNGTTADDDGCVTQAEYAAMYPTADGTDPLDRQVSVNPELEPEAPTVREVFVDPFVRAALAGLSIE